MKSIRIDAKTKEITAMQNATHEPTDGDANDLDILQQLNRHYVRSAEMCDARWYDENLGEDFLASNPDGSLVDRAQFLAQIARPCAVRLCSEAIRWRLLRSCFGRAADDKSAGVAAVR
jgi:hypothetical protein